MIGSVDVTVLFLGGNVAVSSIVSEVVSELSRTAQIDVERYRGIGDISPHQELSTINRHQIKNNTGELGARLTHASTLSGNVLQD